MNSLNAGSSQYNCKINGIEKPTLVGFYSNDENLELKEDLSELKYVVASRGPTHLDLTVGEDKAAVWCPGRKNIPFLKYILKHKEILSDIQSRRMKNVGFVMDKSVLRSIAGMPYTFHFEIVYCAHLFRGVIYLKFINLRNMDQGRAARWGHKFEQYVTRRDLKIESDHTEKVKENNSFTCVFKINLDKNRVLYKSRLDGISADEKGEIPHNLDTINTMKELQKREFVELRVVKNDSNLHHKLRETWLHFFFGAKSKIYFGFRNDDGIVSNIEQYNLEEIENIGMSSWKPNVLINFAGDFLSYVKSCFMRDSRIVNSNDITKLPEIKKYFMKNAESFFINECALPTTYKDQYLPKWYVE